jgi:hypothetical protein
MRANVASRLDTGTPSLQDLIAQLNKGELKVPAFQRRFVWKDEQAMELLDSLASNYPVGSLLLWKTHDKLSTERNIGEFRLPHTDDQSPTDYVLDGQQRLTVIYACLGAEESAGGFVAAYDLRTEKFVPLPTEPSLTLFPLRILYNTTRLLDFRTALQTQPDHRELQQRLDGLVHVLTHYKLPVVTLKDLTLDEVCPIFERINNSGTSLSIYDLMVAATWSRTFDLDREAKKLASSLETKDFDEIEGTTILKVLAAVHADSADRRTILGLRKLKPESALDALMRKAKVTLECAVDLIVTDFGVHCLDFLPYEAHLTILSAILEGHRALSSEEVRRVRSWFWRTALTEYYRGAADTFVTRSLREAKAYVLDEKAGIVVDTFGVAPSSDTLLGLEFRKNSASSRAFALALAKKRPRNLTNGALVDTYVALSAYNRHEFHHIFPRAYLRRAEISDGNRLMNVCMLTASENKLITDQDPHLYIPELVEGLGANANEVFASNLLPLPNEFDYSTTSFGDFRDKRALHAASWLARLCDGLE